MNPSLIRNFCIIAHIDHGKSTLADRMLEVTHTVEARKMRDQVLDSMELERERGITIKMQPVRMQFSSLGKIYTLNLIDTPGHIDFYYEVSRALSAVEGCILLVDATQGVQAQTLTTLSMAKAAGLKIIPALSKVDSPLARIEDVEQEVASLLGISPSEILRSSGRTGEGVEDLLRAVVEKVPPPEPLSENAREFRGTIFDFQYSNHRGIIIYVRGFEGEVAKGAKLKLHAAGVVFEALEVGIFSPEQTPTESLGEGQIGYIVTGIKTPGIARVGDTVSLDRAGIKALPGYQTPKPLVWASIYPESQDDFVPLRQALEKLRLSDSSFSFEEESSGTLGRGYRSGFLGMLHLEIITERLRREFSLELIVTHPTITYEIEREGKKELIYTPNKFPDEHEGQKVFEPWADLMLIMPPEHMGAVMQLLYEHEAQVGGSDNFSHNRIKLKALMPLRELMRNFFDRLKNVTSGYASVSYDIAEMRQADVVRMDVLVADEVVPAFSKIISRRRVNEECEAVVDRLRDLLPRQMFTMKIQAKALGRIVSSRTVAAMKKDVTGYLYGGDITRKMKLREKQKKGKKRMKERGKVNIPQEVFLKMMRTD